MSDGNYIQKRKNYSQQQFTVHFILLFGFDNDSRHILRTFDATVSWLQTTIAGGGDKTTSTTAAAATNTCFLTQNVIWIVTRIRSADAACATVASAQTTSATGRGIFVREIIGGNDNDRWQITVTRFGWRIMFRMWLIGLEYVLQTIEKMQRSSWWTQTTFRWWWCCTAIFIIVTGGQRQFLFRNKIWIEIEKHISIRDEMSNGKLCVKMAPAAFDDVVNDLQLFF